MAQPATKIETLALAGEIGRGSESVLYRVRLQGQTYALKKLAHGPVPPSQERIDRFLNEGIATARLQVAELPKVHEVGMDGDEPYILMELVEGRSLAAHLESEPVTPEFVRSLAITLCRGMLHLEQAGYVHRDIKPANIMLEAGGGVKIIDLGFVRYDSEEQDSSQFLGSASYASPEQLGGIDCPVDHRSDLYSLGVVLYECLYGRLPFTEQNLAELIHAHSSVMPEFPATDLDPDGELVELVQELLAKDPEDRPATSADVLELLDSFHEDDRQAFDNDDRGRVQRKVEEEQLAQFISYVDEGPSALAVVSGSAGSGKSELVATVLAHSATERRAVTVKARADDAYPLRVIRDLLHHLAEICRRDHSLRKQVLKSLGADLQQFLAGFSPDFALMSQMQPIGFEHYEDRALPLLAEALAELNRSFGGLNLVVDDVQWLDHESLAVLAMLINRFGREKFGLIGVYRSEASSDFAVEKFRQGAEGRIHTEIKLAAMSAEQVERVCLSVLGSGTMSPKLRATLCKYSAGNPLMAAELIRSYIGLQAISFSWGEWGLAPWRERLALPGTMVELVLQRMAVLSEDEALTLRYCAIAGSQFRTDLVLQVLASDIEFLPATLRRLQEHRFIEPHAGKWRFTHDKLHEAVLHSVPAEQSQEMHRRFFAECSADGDEESVISAATHGLAIADAIEPVELVRVMQAAGMQAWAQFAAAQTCEWLGHALELAKQNGIELEAKSRLVLGQAYLRIGQPELALVGLEALIDLEESDEFQLNVRFALASGYVACLRCKEAYPHIAAGLKLVGAYQPKPNLISTLTSFVKLALGAVYSLLPEAWVQQSAQQQQMQWMVKFYNVLGQAAYFDHNERLLMQVTSYNYPPASALADSQEKAVAYYGMAVMFGAMQLRKLGEYYIELALGVAQRQKDPTLRATARVFQALMLTFCGEIRAAFKVQRRYFQAEQEWLELGSFLNMGYDYVWNAHILGYVDESQTIMNQLYARSLAANITDSYGLAIADGHKGILQGLRGDLLSARRAMEKMRASAASYADHPFVCQQLCTFEAIYGELTLDSELLDQAEQTYLRQLNYGAMTPLYHTRLIPLFLMYGRVYISMKSPSPQASEALRRALQLLARSKRFPIFAMHYYVGLGHLQVAEQQYDAAEREFQRAERLAEQTDNNLATIEIAVGRALVAAKTGRYDGVARHVSVAVELARASGFHAKMKVINEQFSGQLVASTDRSFSTSKRLNPSIANERRYDALIRVNRAFASAVEISEQIQMALDEIIHVLGSERAFFFKIGERQHDRELIGARDEHRRNLESAEDCSLSMIERVATSQEPQVLRAGEAGSLTESVVIHNIRSVIAAPVMARDQLTGVLYLDSRVARGMFNDDDVDVLIALGNLLGASLEASQAAEIERQKQALAKDLEVSGAVQTLLLPQRSSYAAKQYAVFSHYQPVAQSGGDWWGIEISDERVIVILGDVTGHGVGAAMITAAVAGHFESYRHLLAQEQNFTWVERYLRELDAMLHEVGKDSYWMTITVMGIDLQKNQVEFWNAAGPPVLIADSADQPALEIFGGAPLGAKALDLGRRSMTVGVPTRFVLATDGIYESPVLVGRQYSTRRLKKVVAASAALPANQVVDQVIADVDANRGKLEAQDDRTLLVVDVLPQGGGQPSGK